MNWLRVTTSSVSFFVFACGQTDDGCSEPWGSYVVDYDERGGTCQSMPATLGAILGRPGQVASPCAGDVGYSDDGCEVTQHAVCPEAELGDGWTSELDARTDWDNSASRGDGVLEVTIKDETGAVQCSTTYDSSYQRR